ncbi:unnamed protein product [Phytophthora fragariaefolia]|uniref:Unnamed protein product n=1 Tax=Phytophthora fragariaefolia TaxID=1490495 RepID=A0A9W7D5I7_9STRA|nr:unnamed protein product [Phytophthora fragariaefolia]
MTPTPKTITTTTLIAITIPIPVVIGMLIPRIIAISTQGVMTTLISRIVTIMISDTWYRLSEIRSERSTDLVSPTTPIYEREVKRSAPKKSSATSKYAFVPSEDQVAVHNRITSTTHKGKSASAFCNIRSEHATFKALPGICTQVYDIRFGSGSLSIRHFARFLRHERVAGLESGGSNFDNLSASAEFAEATPAACIDDVVDATTVNGDGNGSSLHRDEKTYEKIKHVRQQSIEFSCALVADYLCEEIDSSGLSVEGACGRHTPIFKTESSEENGNTDEVSCALVAGHPVEPGTTVQFLRGEDAMDSRPNKAIAPERLRLVLDGNPHLNHLIEIAEHGIDAQWQSDPAPKRPPPKNHGSFRRFLRAVTRSIREGQCSGEYMVVDADILELWPEVVCRPLGAVEKKGINPSEEARTIHDLSFPKRNSVNDAFIAESLPKVRDESVKTIAVRIERLANRGHAGRIRILKGDVKGDFRHLRTRANPVFRMAAFIKKLGILVIDLAAPFGWSGSPPSLGGQFHG